MGRTHTTRRAAVALAGGLALIAAGAGCGGSDSGGGSTSGSSAAVDTSVQYARGEVAKHEALVTRFKAPGPDISGIKSKLQGKTVWYVPTFLQAPIFTANGKALEEPLKLAGAKLHTCDAGANPTKASACIRQATAANAAAIVTDAMDWSFASQAQAAAVKAGIPIVATDNDNVSDFPKSKLVKTVGIGIPETWRLAADWIIADSNGKAHLLYASDNSNAGKIHAAAIADEFSKHCPQCDVTVVPFGDLTVQRLTTAVSTAMVKNPKITYVMGGYDAPSGIFALQGAKQVTGRKFKYITATGQPPGLQRVAAGQQEATPGADTVQTMWNTADALFRVLVGADPVPQYDNALRIFTKDNVPSNTKSSAAYWSGQWYTNGAFKPIYRKTWGL
jgi:ribose transport system substrate-binding protein